MVFTSYLIVGAVIGLAVCFVVLKAVKDEDLNDHPVLDRIKYIIDVMGLQQFMLVLFILITLFWVPMMIHRFLTINKNEE